MAKANYDWLDDEYLDDIESFGAAREDLRLVEETFSPDMPDEPLLRLYLVVRGQREENPIWEVIQAKVTDELRARMVGGPPIRLLKHQHGFDPEDHEKLLAAIRANELTNPDMLSYYDISICNEQATGYTKAEARHFACWRAITPLIRRQIIFRLRRGARALRQLE